MSTAKRQWLGYSWMTPHAGVAPHLVSAQYCERPAGGLTGRIIRALWVLDYARSDCGLARVGSPRSRWWPRTARIAHLYPPDTPYWEDTTTVRGLAREGWAIFAGGDEAGLRRLLEPGQRFARIADPAGQLDACLHDMALAGQTLGEAGFWRAQSALAAAFDLLGRAVRQADGTLLLPPTGLPVDDDQNLVGATHRYFQAHLGEKITLATTAWHLRMSPSALSHRYAAEAGQSPMAALTALRLELAKSLLLRGLKMETIAQQAGFCDAFHFSKAFKNHYGEPPSRFRRNLQRAAGRGS
jgi:AraC-like DNA-binding protein